MPFCPRVPIQEVHSGKEGIDGFASLAMTTLFFQRFWSLAVIQSCHGWRRRVDHRREYVNIRSPRVPTHQVGSSVSYLLLNSFFYKHTTTQRYNKTSTRTPTYSHQNTHARSSGNHGNEPHLRVCGRAEGHECLSGNSAVTAHDELDRVFRHGHSCTRDERRTTRGTNNDNMITR